MGKPGRGEMPSPQHAGTAGTSDETYSSGQGRRPRYAFFDVDGTLIRTKSMFGFQEHYYLESTPGPEAFGRLRYRRFARKLENDAARGEPRELINRRYYESYRNRKPEQVRKYAETWFAQLKASMPALYVEQVLETLRKHQAEGVEPVLVSGSSVEILSPLARELGVNHILATRLKTRSGHYTGEILPPQMLGDGKQQALYGFLAESGVSARECFAYGDHISDLPMLKAVGNPRAVGEALGGDPGLEIAAAERGWPVIKPLEQQIKDTATVTNVTTAKERNLG